MSLKLVKKDVRGEIYELGNMKLVYRKKGTVSGDNDQNKKEIIYLINGSARVTLKEKEWIENAPAEFEFAENTYHKIEALEDIIFLVVLD